MRLPSTVAGAAAGALGLAVAACGDARPINNGSGFSVCPQNLTATFSSINANVLQVSCAICHKPGGAGPGGPLGADVMDLQDNPYQNLLASTANIEGDPAQKAVFPQRVVPGDPAHSFLVKKLSITDTVGPFGTGMPFTSPGSVCPDTLNKIQQWIAAGAPNN